MSESFDTGDKFCDFILRITHQIWEKREVLAIRDYYGPDVIVRSPSGVTTGCQSVIDSTYATLEEFPDRNLLGEDVIHDGSDTREWLSSHRIFSTATHLGAGYFGAPTGKALRYRVIADCAVRDGVIFDEWLVRDFGAIVRQMGVTPEAVARSTVAASGGSTVVEDRRFASVAPLYTHRGNDTIEGSILAEVVSDLFRGEFEATVSRFDRAAQFDMPGGVVVNGRDPGLAALRKFLEPLKCRDITIDHTLGHSDAVRGVRAAVRATTFMEHRELGWLGQPSGRDVAALSIWHAEFAGRRIRRLFVLMDEIAMWRQVLSA